jgi:Ca2+-transporting ATPase
MIMTALTSLTLEFIFNSIYVGVEYSISIFVIVLMISCVKVITQTLQERRLAEVANRSAITQVPVYRDSKDLVFIPSTELVVGDLILIQQGFVVPADCVMIKCALESGI